MQKEGGWIFISHSHQDIAVVRKIRNRFEELGFEPLMFYLKCLSDKDEIEGLIKREIDEREWFVYVDSDNSRASKWVRSEREYIESLEGKKVLTIDINGDIIEQADKIARSLKIYVSYSHRDGNIARKIINGLSKRDYQVLYDDKISSGSNWAEEIKGKIHDAVSDGFVLLLVSENSMRSQFVSKEIEEVFKMNGILILLFVDDVICVDMPEPLRRLQGLQISSELKDDELERILNKIEEHIPYIRK